MYWKKWSRQSNVARKIFLEDGGAEETIRWMVACLVNVKLARRKGTEKHRLYHCPEWYEVRREIPEVFRKLEQKARTSKKEWKWQRGIVEHPFSESQWNRDHFRM